ncbi:MAG TPA: hypothetical protein VLM85_20265 [Polyangiaceae bacterium]|nr:hypothetical protein [Polyangiaceae bacterium]
MNPTLSAQETDSLLEVLHRGLILIRLAAAGGDLVRAEAIADALHNVLRLLREGDKWGWTVAEFRERFLRPLIERYPDLAGLGQPLEGSSH